MDTLAELYKQCPLGPVTFRGEVVVRSVRLPLVTNTATLMISVESYCKAPRQAIRVKAKHCLISVLGHSQMTDPVLWADKFKKREMLYLTIHSPKANAEIILYNAWQGSTSLDAWLNESGMIIRENPVGVALPFRVNCSDGLGPADFESLIFHYDYS